MPLSDDRRALLERLIRHGRVVPPAAAVARPSVHPASYAQRRLWFLEQLQDAEAPYTLHAVQELRFPMDKVRLQRALDEIVARHEILRTRFVLDDEEPAQHVDPAVSVPLEVVDLGSVPAAERRGEALRLMGAALSHRFDLERAPLLRTELYRLGSEEWLFLLAVHHIVFDGPSFHLFFRELEAIYSAGLAGKPHGLPVPELQYGDYARGQAALLTPERVAADVAFWRGELAGVPVLDLPFDRPRAAVPSFRGGLRSLAVPATVTTILRQRAAAAKTTLFTALLAGLSAALSRLCAQDDFAIGLPVTGRDRLELQKAIGFFVDTLVTRVRLASDMRPAEILEAVRGSVNRSLSHRQLPFDLLVQHLRPERDLAVNPFFQVGFQLMLEPAETGEAGGLDVVRTSAMFDLCFDLWTQGEGLSGRLQYNSDLFDPQTVDLVVALFLAALDCLASEERPLRDFPLGEAGASGLSTLAGESCAVPGHSSLDVIREVAGRFPECAAVECGDERLSYRNLVGRVDALAAALAAEGVGPRALVALDMGRSLDLTCLQLAAWECGAAFVCLDPRWPEDRRRRVLEEARPSAIASEPALVQRLQGGIPEVGVGASSPAYVIFTSGSTGGPKGVLVGHEGLRNVIEAQRRTFGLGPGRRVGQLASPTFDASIFETALALGSGATLVVAPPEALAGEDLALFLSRSEVDTVVLPPTLLGSMAPETCPSLRLVCVAGESCSADLAARWSEGRVFWNLYGPTEATIWSTFGSTASGSRVAIGRPIANVTTAVVDRALRPVPVGVTGELCIGGVGLAIGYLCRPELTAEKFVAGLPGVDGRVYRTGDLVRQTRAGELVFLGRIDRQLKVRGFRIEPEEIEAVLREHPLVAEAAVAARAVDGEPAVLVAYLRLAGAPEEATDGCRRLLRDRLPQHMMPSHFVAVDALPRTSSGKLDLEALPPPGGTTDARRFAEPATPTERRVAELMARLARVPRVGSEDDFFRIGGHSLAAAQLAARARTLFKVEVAIGDVFRHPTVASLAGHIDALLCQASRGEDEPEVPLVRLPRTGRQRVPGAGTGP